jgi:D-alanyl-D-alanine carboxypeptidase
LKPTDRILAGSTGKSFVAAAILLAVGEGKLDLDAKIEKYLGKEPWFDRLPNAHDITLRQLFNHTAGVAEHVLYPNFVAAVKAEPDKKWKAEELVAFNLDTKPTHAAGQGWDYADAHYNIAGLVYEKVTGKRLFDEIERRLLKPNGLTRTMPSPGVRIPDLATGYNMPNSPFGVTGRSIIDGKCFFNPQCEYGGGGIVSTPSDLAKWAKALYEGKVLPDAMLAEAKKTVPALTGRNHRYGIGIQERPSPWGNTIGHSGWFPGYLTDMVYVPSKRIAVAVQVTTDDQRKLGRNSYAMAVELVRTVIGD